MNREKLEGANRPFVTDRSDPANAINDSELEKRVTDIQRWIRQEYREFRDPKFDNGYWPGYTDTDGE